MDASSFRSTGIKMTIDNPDDFCSFKGKDIDFEDEKYDPFPVYRFKPVAMNMPNRPYPFSRMNFRDIG